MKKILAIILAVSCVLALGSCKLFKKNKEEAPVINEADVSPVQAKIDASVPEKAKVTVKFNSSLGELNSEYFVVYNMDGTATVDYTYEKFNLPTESSDFKSTVPGQTTIYANGTLKNPPAGVASVEALTFDLNLDPTKLYSATADGNILTVVVKAENTQAVLGVSLGADATVIIAVGPLGVSSVAISYTTTEGAVEIGVVYDYYVATEEEEAE